MSRQTMTFWTEKEANEYVKSLNPVAFTWTGPTMLKLDSGKTFWEVNLTIWSLD